MKRGVLLPAPLPAALTPAPPVSGGPGSPSLEAYRGLASWVDLFEERAWRRPGRAVADMAAHGVRTLFLETSNYSQRRTVVNRAAVGRFIDAAHDRGMAVVAWYLPGFSDVRRDLRRVDGGDPLPNVRRRAVRLVRARHRGQHRRPAVPTD